VKRLILLVALAALANSQTVRVQEANGDIVDLPLERYVTQVVAGESSVFQSVEALKAMAVTARTWAVRMRGRHSAEGYDFCATTHCQRLETAPAVPRIEKAAAETAGELMWFEGKPAFTPYTRDCGGRSEDAGAVWPDMAAPYLKVHDDPYCARAGESSWQWSGDPRQLAEALLAASLRSPRVVEQIAIAARTASGRAQTLLLAGGGESVRISAGSFRFAIGRELGWNTVRSDLYEVHASGGRVVFQGRGSGHGAGLCQIGADRMGAEGRSYREILAFYFPGTQVSAAAKDIPWQRLSGEGITLATTNPSQDGPVLALAGRVLRAVTDRTHWPPPHDLEIYLYPDLDRFRNATGEPGWVAAHTTGTRVHLQPATVLRSRGILESTLRHEFLHVLVESQARADLPLWFREGLVEYLANPLAGGAPARIPSDADLRQTSDAARARQAYEDSARMVADLARRYGETAVLDWVKRGVPAEVTNTSASHAPTKSK
jgi:stage II sporulation protein D